mgnify:CR=1 FL=1
MSNNLLRTNMGTALLDAMNVAAPCAALDVDYDYERVGPALVPTLLFSVCPASADPGATPSSEGVGGQGGGAGAPPLLATVEQGNGANGEREVTWTPDAQCDPNAPKWTFPPAPEPEQQPGDAPPPDGDMGAHGACGAQGAGGTWCGFMCPCRVRNVACSFDWAWRG